MGVIKYFNEYNSKKWVIWITRLLVTHNLLLSIFVRNEQDNSIEVSILVIVSVWLTWLRKDFFAMILMILGFYLHLL